MNAHLRTAAKVAKYQISDVVRSRWLVAYALFFLALTESIVRFSGSADGALVTLVSVVLFVIPLVTIVFGTVYVYGAREFTEMLLAQPVGRAELYAGFFVGVTLPLSLGFVAGTVTPFVLHGLVGPSSLSGLAALLGAGTALTFIFTAMAFVIAAISENRLKGLGVAIAIWLVTAVLYDGAVLMAIAAFPHQPLERPLLALMVANPVDLARVYLLLHFDSAALLGYTGAVLQRFFGSGGGALIAGSTLLLWIAAPVALGLRAFRRKDF
jgi:Cu-processing system permease protein